MMNLKWMRQPALWVWLLPALILGGVKTASAATSEVFTLFSDNGFYGVPPNSISAFSGPCGAAGFNGQAPEGSPPEGYSSWKTTETITCDTYLGVGLSFAVAQDLSRFANNGELRFWINAAKGDIAIDIQDSNWTPQNQIPTFHKMLQADLGWNPATDANQWRYYHIPFQGNLTGTGLSTVAAPIVFTAFSTPTTFYIDSVRYVRNLDGTAPSAMIFDVSLNNISDGQSAGSIDWTGAVNLPTGWVRANQYIQMNIDMPVSPWGVQIYTDNTNGTGNTQFTGNTSSTNPAGLVDTTDQVGTLPVAWSVKVSSPGYSTPFAPIAAEPNDNGLNGNPTDPNAFQWLYMKDAQTKNIPNTSTIFVPGDPFMQVQNNLGIHYVQGITLDSTDFGAQNPPVFIYLEANFNGAVIPRTYTTSKLIIELFTP
jgi:hypothetical protein